MVSALREDDTSRGGSQVWEPPRSHSVSVSVSVAPRGGMRRTIGPVPLSWRPKVSRAELWGLTRAQVASSPRWRQWHSLPKEPGVADPEQVEPDTSPAPDPGSSTPGPAPKMSRRARVQASAWRAIRPEIPAAIIAIAVAGISGAAGVANIPWLWILLMSAEFAAIAVCVTHAITVRTLAAKVAWWKASLIVSLVLPLGAFVYHEWFDPAERVPRTYQFVVNGDETQVVELFGEAGGEPQLIQTGAGGANGLIGGQAYEFDCWTIGRDGLEWLRYQRFGRTWWAPRSRLHAPVGVRQGEVPHC